MHLLHVAYHDRVPDRDMSWWSTKPIDMFGGALFWLNAYMSRSRFDQIMHPLRYTDKEAPLFFLDRFQKVCQMIDAFNDHYSKGYKPSWVSCIDESVNTWLILNKFCPGFHSLASRIHSTTNIIRLRMATVRSQSCGGSRSSRERIT